MAQDENVTMIKRKMIFFIVGISFKTIEVWFCNKRNNLELKIDSGLHKSETLSTGKLLKHVIC